MMSEIKKVRSKLIIKKLIVKRYLQINRNEMLMSIVGQFNQNLKILQN